MSSHTHISRRTFVAASSAVACAAGLGLVGCGGSGASNKGELNVYCSNPDGFINAIVPDFQKKTGIKVNVTNGGTGQLFKRLDAEKSNPQADIVWGGSSFTYLQYASLLENYKAKDNDQLPQQFQNTDGTTTAVNIDVNALLVNTDKTQGMNITGYNSLLNDALAGQFGVADPAASASAFNQLINMLIDFGGTEAPVAWNYVQSFYKLVQGKIQTSTSSIMKSAAEGELAIALGTEASTLQYKKDGAKVDIVYPEEGCAVFPGCAGIIKGAPHMDQAKQFIDYLVSKEGQQAIADQTMQRPVRSDIKLNDLTKPLDQIKQAQVDYAAVANDRDKILEHYKQIVNA